MGLLRLAKRNPVTVPADTSVLDAVRLMADHRIGALFVVEDGRAVGVFTERDVMKRLVLEGRNAELTPISEVMTEKIKTVADDTSVHDAVVILRKNEIRHLPIVDGEGKLRGVLSLRDLLYDLNEDLERQAASLAAFMGADGAGG